MPVLPGERADQPPSRPPPFQVGGEKVEAACLLPGGNDVGDLSPRPDTLAPPPCPGGRSGGGRADVRPSSGIRTASRPAASSACPSRRKPRSDRHRGQGAGD